MSDSEINDEDVLIGFHDAFANGDLVERDRVYLRTHYPGTLERWQEEFARTHRPPTREEIIQKMNYRASGWDDVDFERGMEVGVRRILAEALTRPRDEDYFAYFCDGDPTNITDHHRPNLPQGPALQEWWGKRSGEAAAIRWLVEQDREAADEWFPMLTDVRIVD